MNPNTKKKKLKEQKKIDAERRKVWDARINEVMEDVSADTVEGFITEDNFDDVFNELFEAVRAEGIPIKEDVLYDKFCEAFDYSQPGMTWAERIESFKSALAEIGLFRGVVAATLIIAILAMLFGISNQYQSNYMEGWNRHEASIAQQQQSSIDRIFEMYSEEFADDQTFTRAYVQSIFDDYIWRGYNPNMAMSFTERSVQGRAERMKWAEVAQGFEDFLAEQQAASEARFLAGMEAPFGELIEEPDNDYNEYDEYEGNQTEVHEHNLPFTKGGVYEDDRTTAH